MKRDYSVYPKQEISEILSILVKEENHGNENYR